MMKKVKQLLLKDKVIKYTYYFLIAITIFSFIMNNKVDNMDEIWNFSYAKNIIDGLIPYKDFNIIVTPLSMYLNSLLLLIKPTLFSFRIIYFFYYVVLIYLFDKIFDILEIKKILKYIFISIFSLIIVKKCYLDYNFLQFILIMVLLFLNLKNKDYLDSKLNIIVPLLSGLAIINKQSTGLIICFIYILLLLLNKYHFKNKLDKCFIIKQIALMFIPVLLLVVYLFIFNSYKDFYDLAVLGLTTFSNNYFDLNLLFSLGIMYLIMTVLLFGNNKNYELWIIYLYAVASLFVVVPILDIVHATLAIIIPFLFVFLVLNYNTREVSSFYTYLLFPIFVLLIVNNTILYLRSTKMDFGIYKSIPVSSRLKLSIKNVSDYVIYNNSNVYILDFSSTLYDLNIGNYNKYFDLFMNGNFGVEGKKEMFDMIDDNEYIFLVNNQNINWQTPTDIIDYVKNKYVQCGKVDYFDVYCKQ